MNPVVTPVEDGLIIYKLSDEDRKRLRNVKLMSGGGTASDDFIFHRMCIQQAVEMLTQKPEAWEANKLAKRLVKLEENLSNLQAQMEPFHSAYDPTKQEELEKKVEELDAEMVRLTFELENLELTARPICISQVINEAMIQLNDRKLTPRQRGRLKSLVETTMNTCPVKRTVRQYKTKPDRVMETAYAKAPGFSRAERQRQDILRNIGGVPFNEALKLIEKAAAVYKVTEAGLPGSESNPIEVVSHEEDNGPTGATAS